MKKRSLLFVACLFALMLIVSACSDSSDSEGNGGDGNNGNNTNDGNGDEDITLEFWTMQLKPTFTDYIEGMIEDFEEENPNVTINWLDVPASDLEQKILSDVSAGNAPDVVNLNPAFGGKLAELDATVNMDEALSDEEIDQYLDGAWKSNQLEGETFGIPWYLGTSITSNNAALYEEAGLDTDDPPETYEEAAEYAKTIKEETGKYGYFPSFDESLPLQHMEMMGVSLQDDDGTATFNTEKGVEAVQFFTDLYQDDLIPDESLTGEQREGTDFYQSGEVAFGVHIFIDEVKENAPDIYDNTFPSSAITGESGKNNLNVQNLVVPEQTDHEEAAVDFALFITSAENQLEFSKLTPVLPSVEEAVDDPFFTDIPDDADPEKVELKVSAEQLTESELLVPPMDNFNDLQTVMHDAFSRAMLGEQSPEESLDQAEDEWNDITAE